MVGPWRDYVSPVPIDPTFVLPFAPTGVRKPFGEMTNTPPPKPTTPRQPLTPAAAANASSSTPNEEAALTPMANLKLLMKVREYNNILLNILWQNFLHQMLFDHHPLNT